MIAASQSMLIDKYVDQFQFSEYHEIGIECEPAAIFPAFKRINFRNSKVIDLLFSLRGLPRSMGRLSGFLDFGFVLLEERECDELVIGFILGRGELQKVEPHQFSDRMARSSACGAWNFRIFRREEALFLSTETRVSCGTTRSRVLFSLYWFLILPFSGIIRMIMLKMIKEEAEQPGMTMAAGRAPY